MKILDINNLSYQIKEYKVLDDVCFEIEEGQIYGLLGSNGSGKSTLIKIILGLISNISGGVKIFGSSLDDRCYLSKVGSLIEQAPLYGNLNGYDNLRVNAIQHNITLNRVEEILDLIGLKEKRTVLAKNFSTGMKQRLGLGIAILHSPQFLILDEPLNGIDQEGISEIREILTVLNKNFKVTILVTSHLLTELDKIATNIGMLKDGRMIFNGSKSNFVLNAENLESSYFNQVST